MATTRTSILPGFGGKAEFTLEFGDVVILDMSQCATAAFTLKGVADGATVTLEQSFDGQNWAAVQVLDVLGETKKFPITDAIGLIRATVGDNDSSSFVSPTSSDPSPDNSDVTDGIATLHVVGFKFPVS